MSFTRSFVLILLVLHLKHQLLCLLILPAHLYIEGNNIYDFALWEVITDYPLQVLEGSPSCEGVGLDIPPSLGGGGAGGRHTPLGFVPPLLGGVVTEIQWLHTWGC